MAGAVDQSPPADAIGGRRRGRRLLLSLAAVAIVGGAAVLAAVLLQSGGARHARPGRAASAAPAQPQPQPQPPPTPPAAAPVAGKVVAIDPGHNGGNASHPAQINRKVFIGNGRKACDTTGTATSSGYNEAAYTLDVARRARALLEHDGARVVMTRTSNHGVGPCIDERAQIANDAKADVAASIHADGGPPSGRGFHVIYPARIGGLTEAIVEPSRRLALALRAAYRKSTGIRYSTYIGHAGLIQRDDLGGLNLSKVPKVFIETGNMANRADARKLESARFRQRAARAIVAGLESFLTAPSG